MRLRGGRWLLRRDIDNGLAALFGDVMNDSQAFAKLNSSSVGFTPLLVRGQRAVRRQRRRRKSRRSKESTSSFKGCRFLPFDADLDVRTRLFDYQNISILYSTHGSKCRVQRRADTVKCACKHKTRNKSKNSKREGEALVISGRGAKHPPPPPPFRLLELLKVIRQIGKKVQSSSFKFQNGFRSWSPLSAR